MLMARISCIRGPSPDSERQLYAFDNLAGSLVQDGHVLGRENRTILLPDECVLYAFLPARDALEPFTWNSSVKQSMENLAGAGLSMPQVEILGKAEEVSNACECPNSTWFILFTHLFEVHSPVKCGDCFQQCRSTGYPDRKTAGFIVYGSGPKTIGRATHSG